MIICRTGPSYRHYTAEEIAAANDTDLPELLASLGYQVKRVGSYYTTKEVDSLRVKDRRIWYRYSEGKGGDAIAFVRHFCGMSFPEAVCFLLAFNGYPVDSPISPPIQISRPPPQRGRPAFVLPTPNGDNERVCAYLRRRGIAPGVIDDFIDMGLLYEDRAHHNCVFVGYDSTGKAVFAAQRGIWDSIPFRGDVTGSNKRIAFRLPCDAALDAVRVFEAPIDLMSWFTLYGKCNAVALCGLYDGPLETYLDDNPHIRRIILCLDADEWGRRAAGRIEAKYRALGYGTETRFPPSGNPDCPHHTTKEENEVNMNQKDFIEKFCGFCRNARPERRRSGVILPLSVWSRSSTFTSKRQKAGMPPLGAGWKSYTRACARPRNPSARSWPQRWPP